MHCSHNALVCLIAITLCLACGDSPEPAETATEGSSLVEFFADHPRGTVDSPYAAGLPGDFADYCELRAKTGG